MKVEIKCCWLVLLVLPIAMMAWSPVFAQDGLDGLEAFLDGEENFEPEEPEDSNEAPEATGPRFADFLLPAVTKQQSPEVMQSFQRLLQKLQSYSDKTFPAHVERVIRGKAGIPFPTEQELIQASGLGNLPKLADLIKDTVVNQIKQYQENLPEGNALQWCKKSTTTTIPGGENSGSGKLEYDRLFIRPEDIITKPEELFGSSAVVQEVPPEQDFVASIALRELGVDCLPARLRVVGGITYLDTGKNALRNFEKNQHAGEMHKLMESYLRSKER